MKEQSEAELCLACPSRCATQEGKPCSHKVCWGAAPSLGHSDTGHPVTPVKVEEEQHCSHREALEILPFYSLLLL